MTRFLPRDPPFFQWDPTDGTALLDHAECHENILAMWGDRDGWEAEAQRLISSGCWVALLSYIQGNLPPSSGIRCIVPAMLLPCSAPFCGCCCWLWRPGIFSSRISDYCCREGVPLLGAKVVKETKGKFHGAGIPRAIRRKEPAKSLSIDSRSSPFSTSSHLHLNRTRQILRLSCCINLLN